MLDRRGLSRDEHGPALSLIGMQERDTTRVVIMEAARGGDGR